MKKIFNIVVLGVGGQGLMTLLNLLSQAAFLEGKEVKTSELHGLSQRGGSVAVHIRFGEKVFSPMVAQGDGDLIIALESQEALNGAYFANQETVFLINDLQTPTLTKDIDLPTIKKEIDKVSKKNFIVKASEICQKELSKEIVSGIYLLGFALSNNFLPLKKENIIKAIKNVLALQHQEINIKALELNFPK